MMRHAEAADKRGPAQPAVSGRAFAPARLRLFPPQQGVDEQRNEQGERELVKVPPQRYGLVFVFRTFERVSYALVMDAALPLLPAEVPVLVLPAQNVGLSTEHLNFPGTLSLPPKLIIDLWTAMGNAVARAFGPCTAIKANSGRSVTVTSKSAAWDWIQAKSLSWVPALVTKR